MNNKFMDKIEKVPDHIKLCYLEVVVMPNGEIISCGKTLGWFDTFKGYLFGRAEEE